MIQRPLRITRVEVPNVDKNIVSLEIDAKFPLEKGGRKPKPFDLMNDEFCAIK